MIIIFISILFAERKDKRYYCYAIGIDNNSTYFYLSVTNGDNDEIKKYEVKGIEYSKAIEKAEKEGYEIDFNILNAVYFSNDLNYENENAFIENYKNIISLKTLIYKCDLNILLDEDVVGNQGIFIIPEMFGERKDSTIFLDVLYKRKSPLTIFYSGDKFVVKRFE